MQIYMYNSDDFDSLTAALREKRIIAAMAVFFQVGTFFSKLVCVCALIKKVRRRPLLSGVTL